MPPTPNREAPAPAPDRSASVFELVVYRLLGALFAVAVLGPAFLVTWRLVAEVVAWAAGLLVALWVAFFVLALPRLRRRYRASAPLRRLIDGAMGLYLLLVPFQAVLFTSLALFAAGTMLGLEDGVADPGASFAIGTLYVATFLVGFGGLLPAGILLASRPAALWRLFGILLALAGVALGTAGNLLLPDLLEPLVARFTPGRLSAGIFGAEALASALVMLAVRPAFTPRGWRAVAVSPGGDQVLLARPRRSVVLGPGGRVTRFPLGGPLAAFSPCGRWAVVADFDGSVALLDTEGPALHQRLFEGRAQPRAAAFSPDGALLAVGDDDGWVQIWHTRDGRLVRAVSTPLERAAALAFDVSGVLAMDANYRLVRVPLDAGEPVALAERADFVPDEGVPLFPRPFLARAGRRLALAGPQVVTFFDRADGSPPMPRAAAASTTPVPYATVAFSPSGDAVALADGAGRLQVLAWDRAEPLLDLRGLGNDVTGLALDPVNGRVLVSGKEVRAFDLATGASRVLWPVGQPEAPGTVARRAS